MKSCHQCGSENLPNAKFCGECGQKFSLSENRDTAIESETLSAGSPASFNEPQDLRAKLEQFAETISPDHASLLLQKSIEEGRSRLKSLGAAIPKSTNPLISSLMESLKSLPPAEVGARIAIVTALGRTGDPAILPPLLLVTGARSKDVRKAVAIALGTLRHPLAAYLLLPMLTDASSRVKQSAFQVLIQQNQPHTVEAILFACLCSKTLRNVIHDTLKRIPHEKRIGFLQRLSEVSVNRDLGLKTVVDWLRYEFRNELAQSAGTAAARGATRTQQMTRTPELNKSPGDVAYQYPTRVASSAVSQASSKAKRPESAVEKPTTSSSDAQLAAHFTKAFATDSSDLDDDDSHLDLSSDSLADIDFFNSMVDNFASSSDSDDVIPVQNASNGSHGAMSLSGMLAGPQMSSLSNFEMDRPQFPPNSEQAFQSASRSSGNNFSPFPSTSAQYPGSSFAANTPGQSMPTMPFLHPSQMTPPYQMPMINPAQPPMISGAAGMPVQYSPLPSANTAVQMGMTASSPFISTLSPAVSATQQSESPYVATTGSPVQASTPTSTTATTAPSGAAVVSVEPSDEEKAEAEKVREAKAAKERSIARLTEARDVAFRSLVKSGEEIPNTTLPRLLTKRISKLMATPSTDVDSVVEQIKHIGETGSPAVLSTLSSFCQKPAKVVREACAIAMGSINHPGSVVLLLKLLADKSGTVAEAAIKSISKIDIEQTRPVLLASGLCNSSLRSIVTAGIENASDEKKVEWEKFLLGVLQSRDAEAAALAVSLLPRITGDTHVEIYQKLASSDSPYLRAAAVEALARTESKRSISQINEAMEDSSPLVRAQAALAVASMYSPRSLELLQSLSVDKDLIVRRNAAQSMSRIDEESLSEVVARALDQETDATTVEYLLAALQRNGAAGALPILQRYVEGEGGQFREQAVKALRKLKIPSSVPIFRRLLDDHSATLRRQSIEQLSTLKAEGVIPRIQELLKSDPDETVRAACAKGLGDLGDEGSMHLLEEAIEDHSLVRLQAVIALGRLGKTAAGPVLLGLLKDTTPEIRYQAVRAVGQLKLEGVEEQIAPLLEDSDKMVRHGAEQALQDLGQSLGSIRSKRARKRFVSFASMLAPSTIAGMVPGGSKSLLALIFILLMGGGYWGLSKMSFVMAGGEDLPVGWIRGLSVSAPNQVAAALREDSVLDIWSLADKSLVTRVSVPETTTGVLVEPKGGIILLMGEKLGRLDPEANYDPEKSETIDLPRAPASLSFHDASSSICLLFGSGGSSTLSVRDTVTLQESRSIPIKGTLEGSLTISADFSAAISLDAKGVLHLADLASGAVVSAAVEKFLAPGTSLGTVYAATFTGDMKNVVFCGSKSCIILDSKNLGLTNKIDSPDPYGFINAKPINDGSDLVLLSASGVVFTITDHFKNVTQSRIERDESFDVSSLSGRGELVAVANTEGYDFDVYSVTEKATVMTSTQ